MKLTKEESDLLSDKKSHILTVITILFFGLMSYINKYHYELFLVISKAALFIMIVILSIAGLIMIYFVIYLIWKTYLSGKF